MGMPTIPINLNRLALFLCVRPSFMIQNRIVIHEHAIVLGHSQKSNQIIKESILRGISPFLIEFTEIPQIYSLNGEQMTGRTVNPIANVHAVTAFGSGRDPDCSDSHVFEEGDISGKTLPMISVVVDVPLKSREKSPIRRSWLLR
jgi:hypothetical protein